jgi:hypothetical protein
VSATVYSAIGDSRSDSTPAELKGGVSNAQELRLRPVDAIWKVVAAGELEEA